MMRSIKCQGGLTKRRGVTESVRTLWINSTHRIPSIPETMTYLARSKYKISVQHAEKSDKRIERATRHSNN